MGATERPLVHLERREDWRAWLTENHASSDGVWLISWRRPTGRPSIPHAEAVEEALCFGWIDSLARRLDEDRRAQLFTPRRTGSRWSRVNKERVARLQAARLVEPSGAAVIEAAKADGSWSAYDEVDDIVVPDDLIRALADAGAMEVWESFPPSVKRGHLSWLVQAKRPETRARRIEQIATQAAAGRRANY